jgi:hypothetical protein
LVIREIGWAGALPERKSEVSVVALRIFHRESPGPVAYQGQARVFGLLRALFDFLLPLLVGTYAMIALVAVSELPQKRVYIVAIIAIVVAGAFPFFYYRARIDRRLRALDEVDPARAEAH